MKLTLRQQLTQFADILQNQLFPAVEETLGELDGAGRRLVTVLEMVPLARFVPCARGWTGRPSKDRLAIACAFVAKAVYGFSLTRQLIERLQQDPQLRRICGWKHARQVPHESTFSRAFAEFAAMELPQFVHAALIASTQKDRLIGHIARDSTAIEARERFTEPMAKGRAKQKADGQRKEERKRKRQRARKQAAALALPAPAKQKRSRGPHPRYSGGKPKYAPRPETRLHQQRQMNLPEMLAELPRHCSLGVKTKEGGNQ